MSLAKGSSDDAGVRIIGVEDHLRNIGRQVKLRAESGDVGQRRGIEVGGSGDGDFLAGTVDTGLVEGGDVVDGREVIGDEGVNAGRGSGFGLLPREIVQAVESQDGTGKRGGDGKIGGIGEVALARPKIAVNFGVECFFNLACDAAKGDPRAAPRDPADLEPTGSQPIGRRRMSSN